MTSDSTDTSVVVIGGGQAGLSVSYYLKRLGLDPGNEFVVLDRGPGSGGAWQFRWDALRIGSAHRINDLPGMDAIGRSFETADRHRPAKDVVAEYYEAYERHFGFQVVRPAAVTRVENAGDRMVVTFSDGEGVQAVSTDVVINATGTWGSPFIPWYPGRDSFAGRHVHTAEYVDAAEFAGQKVVVVGGGTSAIGFLLELEPVVAETTWVSRRPIEFLEDGELNLEARASAVAMQDEAARAGRALPSIVSGTGVPRTRRIQAGIDRGVLTARPMFAAIEPGGVRWANGAFQEADVILWSTGFRPELRHLASLKLREKEGGIIVANGTSWKEPRIFFAGYGPQASTIGANRAGRTVARQAIATLSRLKRQEREADELRRAADGARPFSFDFTPAAVATTRAPTHAAGPAHAVEREAVLTEDVLARIVVAEPDAAYAPPAESQHDIDLSWMLPSDEPMDPLDYLPVTEAFVPVAGNGVPPGTVEPDAPEVHVQFESEPSGGAGDPTPDAAEWSSTPVSGAAQPDVALEPAAAAQFGLTFLPEPDAAPPLPESAEAPAEAEPQPALQLTRFAFLARAEAAAFVEREPVIAWYSDPTPTVAFEFDSSPWGEPASDSAVEAGPAVEPAVGAEDHSAPEPQPDAETPEPATQSWAEPVTIDPPEGEPRTDTLPVLTMEELFAPVLEPEASHEAQASVESEPWAERETAPAAEREAETFEPRQHSFDFGWKQREVDDAHREIRPFALDVEPEYDDADEDDAPSAAAHPPRRKLPDFDDLLKPRDDA
ncbi:MAG: NAD(P)/FAD-dependent oxidoreductase [Microbacteriaceae bacterium]|nr:NAD(P)/FAD-dependent oxidoreductase [Microbacteriaceae bacterium]